MSSENLEVLTQQMNITRGPTISLWGQATQQKGVTLLFPINQKPEASGKKQKEKAKCQDT